MFLRTTEFLWQEGHTAHADEADAMAETLRMFDVYDEFARNVAAIPMVRGEKTPGERFAGAVRTFTIEGMMRDGKALQSGTSHYLGTNFAKAFDITYQDVDNELKLCHTTSWGLSARMIGAVILAHGDDRGLVLPPGLAPHQVVIVPIGRGEDLDATTAEAKRIAGLLRDEGVRVFVDTRDQSPGFKFNDWELKGVPLRVELGPRDLAAGVVVLAQRVGDEDEDGRARKHTLEVDELVTGMLARLAAYHDLLVARAQAFRDEHSAVIDDMDAFVAQVAHGFAHVLHCGEPACEASIQERTRATPRCVPTEGDDESGACIACGRPSAYGRRVVFARAY
jgi:prolyl-tRNA synthetase